MRVEHQRQQAHRLGLVRNEGDDDAAEPDRLLGEVAPTRIVGERFRPAMRKGGVDRLERHAEPFGQILPLGNLERHAREANFRLRAREALAHCRRRNQKGRSNRRRVQPQDRLQHQRRAYGLLDRRMGASEHEREAPIGNSVRRVGGLLQFGVDQLERFRRLVGGAPPARSVDEAPPRRLREPPFRVRRAALGSARRQAPKRRRRRARLRLPARRATPPRDRRRACRNSRAPRGPRPRERQQSRRAGVCGASGAPRWFCLQLGHSNRDGEIRRYPSSVAPVSRARLMRSAASWPMERRRVWLASELTDATNRGGREAPAQLSPGTTVSGHILPSARSAALQWRHTALRGIGPPIRSPRRDRAPR